MKKRITQFIAGLALIGSGIWGVIQVIGGHGIGAGLIAVICALGMAVGLILLTMGIGAWDSIGEAMFPPCNDEELPDL